MVVGTVTIELHLHGVRSLKEKRSVVKRIIKRVRDKFEVSVAEVDNQDYHQSSTIGCALVTNDGRFANSLLDKLIDFVEELHLAEVVNADIQIHHV